MNLPPVFIDVFYLTVLTTLLFFTLVIRKVVLKKGSPFCDCYRTNLISHREGIQFKNAVKKIKSNNLE